MTSFIEKILKKSVDVECQYDEKNSYISSNQCSWCAYEFANNAKQLCELWKSNEIDSFKKIYNKCVQNGSEQRKKINRYKCGENIDDKNIEDEYKNLSFVDLNVIVLNEKQKEVIDLLDNELKNNFFIRDN